MRIVAVRIVSVRIVPVWIRIVAVIIRRMPVWIVAVIRRMAVRGGCVRELAHGQMTEALLDGRTPVAYGNPNLIRRHDRVGTSSKTKFLLSFAPPARTESSPFHTPCLSLSCTAHSTQSHNTQKRHTIITHTHTPRDNLSEAHTLVEEGQRLRDVELQLALIEHKLLYAAY